MKLGNIKINWIGIGVNVSRAAYLGSHLVGSANPPPPNPPPPNPEAYPLLQPAGKWQDWTDNPPNLPSGPLEAPIYVANLTYPVFDVTMYGADPTGETNSTAAFRAAQADAALAEEGTVYFPEGVYTVWPTEAWHPDTNPRPRVVDISSGITYEGDGPTKTIISLWAPGGVDPNSLIMIRGTLFTNVYSTTPVSNCTFRGMRLTGNAAITSHAGDYEGEVGSLEGWDTNHKAVFLNNVSGISTGFIWEFLECDNWRGEELYAGGTGLGDMLVRKCLIRDCNASAVSMGGSLTQEDTYSYRVLQGTENFCTSGQSMIYRRNVCYPNKDLPPDMLIGASGPVYHGYRSASLLVEDNTIGWGYNGGVFMAEFASNVTIQDNLFDDAEIGIYSINLNQYAAWTPVEELNQFQNHIYRRNVFRSAAKDMQYAIRIYSTVTDGLLIEDNVIENTGDFHVLGGFSVSYWGADGTYVVQGNTLPYCNPLPGALMRPIWTDNVVTGDYEMGAPVFSYSSDPETVLYQWPTWGRVRISDIGGGPHTLKTVVPGDALNGMPDGWEFEMRRHGASDSGTGGEILPDENNTLDRGYMLYRGAVLTLAKNGLTGRLDLVSWTPRTPDPDINHLSQSSFGGGGLCFTGHTEVWLQPSIPHTFDYFSGIAIGETATLHVTNSNTTITHIPGYMEIDGGADFVSTGAVDLYAVRTSDGVLHIGPTPHTYAPITPRTDEIIFRDRPGVYAQTGPSKNRGYQVTATEPFYLTHLMRFAGYHTSFVDGTAYDTSDFEEHTVYFYKEDGTLVTSAVVDMEGNGNIYRETSVGAPILCPAGSYRICCNELESTSHVGAGLHDRWFPPQFRETHPNFVVDASYTSDTGFPDDLEADTTGKAMGNAGFRFTL